MKMIVKRDDQVEATFLRFNIFSPDEFAAIFANELSKTLDEFKVKKRLESQETLSSKTSVAPRHEFWGPKVWKYIDGVLKT